MRKLVLIAVVLIVFCTVHIFSLVTLVNAQVTVAENDLSTNVKNIEEVTSNVQSHLIFDRVWNNLDSLVKEKSSGGSYSDPAKGGVGAVIVTPTLINKVVEPQAYLVFNNKVSKGTFLLAVLMRPGTQIKIVRMFETDVEPGSVFKIELPLNTKSIFTANRLYGLQVMTFSEASDTLYHSTTYVSTGNDNPFAPRLISYESSPTKVVYKLTGFYDPGVDQIFLGTVNISSLTKVSNQEVIIDRKFEKLFDKNMNTMLPLTLVYGQYCRTVMVTVIIGNGLMPAEKNN